MRIRTGISFIVIIIFATVGFSMTANPIISRGKTVYSSRGNLSYLTDNKYGGQAFMVSDNSWIAINVDAGPAKVLLNWNNPGYSWSDLIASATSCKSGLNVPVDYDILISTNSTNGDDGDWTPVLNIRNNSVTARAHSIDFGNSQWLKMSIVNGGGSIDEIEVFDVTSGGDDIWFFPGTSISANAYKSNPPSESFADLITKSNPSFTPAVIRGGIPCINSTTMANDISAYIDIARNAKYWAIEMGTNDAWGGSAYNVSTYKSNMQKIIDSCKANGIQPVIAKIIGTDSSKAGWQVHPGFLRAIDSLTVKNNLIPGPDFYTYFSTHTSELSDGVHPNAAGGASMFRLWAEKMDSLYAISVSTKKGTKQTEKMHSGMMQLKLVNKQYEISVKCAGTLSIYSLSGALINEVYLPANGSYKPDTKRGVCIARFLSSSVLLNTCY